MATKSGSSLRFDVVTREQFVATPLDLPADKFAKTFVAKADSMELWPFAEGEFAGDVLCSCIIVRLGLRYPVIANLQLLHTFAPFRRQGSAARLVQRAYAEARRNGAQYFRVSSEPEAVPFYLSQGFKFWGEQKSGSLLSMHKVAGPLQEGVYNPKDPVIAAAIFSKRKGGVVNMFEELRG